MTKPCAPHLAMSVFALFVLCGPAAAEETGVASIHPWVRMGHRTCLEGHFHDGSGSGPTRGLAQREAIRAWINFTAWEYGSSWGSYGLAVHKRMGCSGGRGNWYCSTEAIPCRGR
jgi:hypothetical protein